VRQRRDLGTGHEGPRNAGVNEAKAILGDLGPGKQRQDPAQRRPSGLARGSALG